MDPSDISYIAPHVAKWPRGLPRAPELNCPFSLQAAPCRDRGFWGSLRYPCHGQPALQSPCRSVESREPSRGWVAPPQFLPQKARIKSHLLCGGISEGCRERPGMLLMEMWVHRAIPCIAPPFRPLFWDEIPGTHRKMWKDGKGVHGALGSLNAWKLLLPVNHSRFCPIIAWGGERFWRARNWYRCRSWLLPNRQSSNSTLSALHYCVTNYPKI